MTMIKALARLLVVGVAATYLHAATPATKNFVSDLLVIMIALNPAVVCR